MGSVDQEHMSVIMTSGSTILSYPKLIIMEETIAAMVLAISKKLCPYRRKAQAATAIRGRDTVHANRESVANAGLCLLSESCPWLFYPGSPDTGVQLGGGKEQ